MSARVEISEREGLLYTVSYYGSDTDAGKVLGCCYTRWGARRLAQRLLETNGLPRVVEVITNTNSK